jgi:sulfatase modifying factor 1
MPEWIPNGGRGPLQAPWPVTLGEPTPFGLLGIATNVHEWRADWHDKDYYGRSPERNPAGPDQGVRRAARGGAWRHAHTIAASRCAVSSIRPSATTTLGFAWREASEQTLSSHNGSRTDTTYGPH